MNAKSKTNEYFIVHLSGGRSSAMMLWLLLERHSGVLPPNWYVIFCNTGKEREETLIFVRDLADRWGVPIVWLEYRYRPERSGKPNDRKHWFEQVDFSTASRNGEPFETLINVRNFLPNIAARFCTSELKIKTASRYMNDLVGPGHKINLLGIRYDEPRRVAKLRASERNVGFPLWEKRVTVQDVTDFWNRQNFDLGIDSRLGNCDLCFLKGRANLVDVLRNEPDRAQWWINQELQNRNRKDLADETHGLFKKGRSYTDLLEESKQPTLFDVAYDAIPDDMGGCFCGD